MRTMIIIAAAAVALSGTSALAAPYVLNSAGKCIDKPTGKFAAAAMCKAAPAAAGGIKCKDGTMSPSKTTKGACSKHGGIAK